MSTRRKPSRAWVDEVASRYQFDLTDDEIVFAEQLIEQADGWYRRVESLFEQVSIPPSRRELHVSSPDERDDPYNAFTSRFTLSGDRSGDLTDVAVGIKDAIAVAGVPATRGSETMEGFKPRVDAPVVTRLLDAGATIVGKTNQTPFSFMDLSVGETSATGPVINPRDVTRTPGGSSSGSAVAVVTGDVDLALGTDQGGSIRGPAASTGCVGLKPTWGLVPYTGIESLEDTLDHVGPMAMSAERCADALDAMAGVHPSDHRQCGIDASKIGGYADCLTEEVTDLTIGVLHEGFDTGGGQDPVHETVATAIDLYEDWGATVDEVSIPMTRDSMAIWLVLAFEGMMFKARVNGLSPFTNGGFAPDDVEQRGEILKARGQTLPLTMKGTILLGERQFEMTHGSSYTKAQIIRNRLRARLDEVFDTFDLLVLPTSPTIAGQVPNDANIERGLAKLAALAESDSIITTFNLTGHPAISVPCGTVDSLPVGLQLVGDHLNDGAVLAAAHALQARGNGELDLPTREQH